MNVVCMWLALLLSISATDAVTQLKCSIPEVEACVGENVTFTCSTTTRSLRWTITLRNLAIRPKVVAFRSSDIPGTQISINDNGLRLHFSFVANPLNLTSTLIVHASEALDYASIECHASSTELLTFRILTDSPSRPANIEIIDRIYGEKSSNVTLMWLPIVGRLSHYNLYLNMQTVLQEFQVNTAMINLQSIPYNQEVTASVSAENCFTESEKSNITFTIYGCNCPLSPSNALLHNMSASSLLGTSAPGDVIKYVCLFTEEFIELTCRQNGLWYPDPSTVSCKSVCKFPTLNNSTIMIEPTNDSVEVLQDTKLSLRCRNGFISTKFQWETIVCSRNGTWVPDPFDYDCQPHLSNMTNGKDQNDSVMIFNSCNDVKCFYIVGAILSIILGVALCGISCATIKKWRHGDRSRNEPIYDTIDPTYEANSVIQNEVGMTDNAAYQMKYKVHIPS